MLVVGFGHFEVNMNIEQDEHGERLNKVNYILDPQKMCVIPTRKACWLRILYRKASFFLLRL
jgi:hypothetical protein